MKFQFTSVYDRRHLASILHAANYTVWAAKPNTKKLWQLGRKFAPLVTLVGVAIFLIVLMTSQNFTAVLLGLLIAAAGMRMGQRPSPTGRSVKQLWRSYDKRGMEIRFCFKEDEMVFYCSDRTERYAYDQLARVLEEPKNFFLSFNSGGIACVLVKKEITCGTVDDFRNFMVEKTGKPVEYFK